MNHDPALSIIAGLMCALLTILCIGLADIGRAIKADKPDCTCVCAGESDAVEGMP